MDLINLSYLGTVISSFVAVFGVSIALFQINGLKKSINYSNLTTILNIEFELNRRKERLADMRQNIFNKINGRTEVQIKDDEKEVIRLLDGTRSEAYEDYLNLFDRLSYFILNGKLNENDFRLEYREMLFDTIENDDEEMFTGTTRYRNMLKLYNRWKEK